ncbi:putative alpha-E superfamily protein [Tahibacter aquaticus]|uniref:Putative alpha-E superfamily protein n=1 Tax=Tahibacter aquaticus TaxID=520092 RepID=A0A4R6Z4F8_9GAMM|nr:alpha-E domain-containing protein [Tahibacter aquaticus]TDR46578.1 putative alpha-E superfamily protein [Tahibacter aquaticus]
MLCRTANDLYWASRHMERAENTARLIDVTLRIALLPERYDRGKAEAAVWCRALDALDLVDTVRQQYGRIDGETVLRHLILAADNPSSIYSCLRAAREAARAQRVAITGEMYEDLNTSWLDMRNNSWARIQADGINNLLEWVKSRSASFRGVTIGTLGRGEGYHFLQLGAFIERADWAIRLLDIAGSDTEAEAPDTQDAAVYFRWSALLQSLSAFETYRRLYRETVSAATVAELMLLQESNPRSLLTCTSTLHGVLRTLAGGQSLECVRLAGALSAQSRYARIDEVLGNGLEPWLQDAMARLSRLGEEIHRQFMLSTDIAQPTLPQLQVQP